MVGICCHPRLYKESKTGSEFSAESIKALSVVFMIKLSLMPYASFTKFHKNARKTPSHIIIYQVYHILGAVSITKPKKICYKFFTCRCSRIVFRTKKLRSLSFPRKTRTFYSNFIFQNASGGFCLISLKFPLK